MKPVKSVKPFHTEGGVEMEKVRSRDCGSIHVMFCTVAEPSSLLRTCSMKSSQVLSPGNVTKGWSHQYALYLLK